MSQPWELEGGVVNVMVWDTAAAMAASADARCGRCFVVRL